MSCRYHASSLNNPQKDSTTNVTQREWEQISTLNLFVYVEFPATLPAATATATATHIGTHTRMTSEAAAALVDLVDLVGAPVDLVGAQTLWERVVVTKSFHPDLPMLSLLHPHKYIDYVQLPPTWLARADLVIARVAGYSNASLGLPPATAMHPLLVPATERLLVAATQLSQCRTRRFAPSRGWMAVVDRILTFTSQAAAGSMPLPLWTPSVTASFTATETLPLDAEKQALLRGVQFYRNSLLMPTPERALQLASLNCTKGAASNDACDNFARLAPPFNTTVGGEGQLGVMEGLTSDISVDGSQPQSIGVRCDCVTETSAAFAVRGLVSNNSSDIAVAKNLLNYGHIHSGYHQPWVVGGGPSLKETRPWVRPSQASGVDHLCCPFGCSATCWLCACVCMYMCVFLSFLTSCQEEIPFHNHVLYACVPVCVYTCVGN